MQNFPHVAWQESSTPVQQAIFEGSLSQQRFSRFRLRSSAAA